MIMWVKPTIIMARTPSTKVGKYLFVLRWITHPLHVHYSYPGRSVSGGDSLLYEAYSECGSERLAGMRVGGFNAVQ